MNNTFNKYLMENMSWPEVAEALNDVKLAIIPIGAHEQHGPHLAESCDAIRAEKFSELLAERMHPLTIVTPTINFGISPHHMPFPGTITLKPTTLIALLKDIIGSLKEHGINKILILNSHGGNDDTLGAAIDEIRKEIDISIASVKYTNLSLKSIDKHVESKYFGHACEREVSEIKYLAPEYLKEDRITKGKLKESIKYYFSPLNIGEDFDIYTENGALGNANNASIEIGEDIINEALDNAEKYIMEFIEK